MPPASTSPSLTPVTFSPIFGPTPSVALQDFQVLSTWTPTPTPAVVPGDQIPSALLWILRIFVALLNLLCLSEYFFYSLVILASFVYAFYHMRTLKQRVMIVVIVFAVVTLELTVIPLFIIYFPTALFELYPQSHENWKYQLTGASFLPSSVINASTILFLVTYILFNVCPFVGTLSTLGKYGIYPKRKKVEVILKEGSPTAGKKVDQILAHPSKAPTVLIVMPIYNEDPEALFNAVLSVSKSNYLKSCMHLFLAFDNEPISELYLRLLDKMGVFHPTNADSTGNNATGTLGRNRPLSVEEQFEALKIVNEDGSIAYNIPTQFTVKFEGLYVTICRFPHNGKRATQAKAFKLLNKMYGRKGSNIERTFVLYIDSDIILHENAVYEFSRSLELNPAKVAYTGLISVRTSLAPRSFLVAYQDAEYLHSQLIDRAFEAFLGGVVCLPGALTMIRLRALKEVAPHYFTRLDTHKTLDYHRFHLGEDRYMTHLLMEKATHGPKNRKRILESRRRMAENKPPKRQGKISNAYTIGFCPAARCKTEAPDTFQKLLKQRRRWFLGAVINEIYMLISPELWFHTPFLMFAKLWDFSCRSMILYVTLTNMFLTFVIFPRWSPPTPSDVHLARRAATDSQGTTVLDLIFPRQAQGTTSVFSWLGPIIFFLGPMTSKFLVLAFVGVILRRWRMVVLFPLLPILQPAFGLLYTIYSLRTYALRSWGGPRTDHSATEDPFAAWKFLNESPNHSILNEDDENTSSSQLTHVDKGDDGSMNAEMKDRSGENPHSLKFVELKSLDDDDRCTVYQTSIFGSLFRALSTSGRSTISRLGGSGRKTQRSLTSNFRNGQLPRPAHFFESSTLARGNSSCSNLNVHLHDNRSRLSFLPNPETLVYNINTAAEVVSPRRV